MGLEGIRKIREGLVSLIDGLIEDTGELLEESPPEHRITKEVVEYRVKQIEDRLRETEEYSVDRGEVKVLRLKYDILKNRIKKELK